MKIHILLIFFLVTTINAGCKKNFLDKNPSSNLAIIQTLADCQELLNNTDVFYETPVMGELSTNDYYLTESAWSRLNKQDQNIYTWQPKIYEEENNSKVLDYFKCYEQVNIANTVLEALKTIKTSVSEEQEKNSITGTALFLRSYAFYNLLQEFARSYEQNSALSDTGIAIPVISNYSQAYVRASMFASYGQIISDLEKARILLPSEVKLEQTSKPAADALLARIYLNMRDYNKANNYADSTLLHYKVLMDFNQLDTAASSAIPPMNNETLYYSHMITRNHLLHGKNSKETIIDSSLYDLYEINDLRKYVYYSLNDKKQPILFGSYSGKVFLFSGLAVDEVYLIRAECRARANRVSEALDDMNTLLVKRYKTGTFKPIQDTTWQEVLRLVLIERRKELAFRGLRWTDLRRLNKEGANIPLNRNINNQSYQLLPNDLRYTFPIPQGAITGSQIVQNPR